MTNLLSSGPFERLRKPQPIENISLHKPHPSGVNTYTNLNTTWGDATFSVESNLAFDQVSISFVGPSKTMIEQIGVARPAMRRIKARHTFLRLA